MFPIREDSALDRDVTGSRSTKAVDQGVLRVAAVLP